MTVLNTNKSHGMSPALAELDAYSRKYLLAWEDKSTVRTQKRSRFKKASLAKVVFPLSLKPFMHLPEVQALSKKKLQPFYLQSFCDMLHQVGRFEVMFVTDQCGKLANEDLGLELTDSVRQVAIAIGIDEMYHALVAKELVSDIGTLAGVIPTALKAAPPVKKTRTKQAPPPTALEVFKAPLPERLHRLSEAILLCILENAVVDDIIEMARYAGSDNPADVYVREHLTDESRHKIFFQRLLKYIWTSISEKDQVVLGRAIVKYLVYFNTMPVEQLAGYYSHTLREAGLSDEIARTLGEQVATHDSQRPLYELNFVSNPVHLMRVAGVLDHLPTRKLFIKHRLIAA